MKQYLFNRDWEYKRASGGSLSAMLGEKAESEKVTLPHDSVIGTERVNEPTLASVAFYKGAHESYIKHFDAPEEYRGKAVWLELEGAYQWAYIYLNGSYVGQGMYGYGNYFFDLTNFLKIGQKNELKILVRNGGTPAGRWYVGGGIYRDVNLYVGGALHIACEGTRVSAEEIEEDQAVLRIETPLRYRGAEVVSARVINEVIAPSGEVVACAEAPITILPNESQTLRMRVTVANAKLWDAENPNLYTIRSTVLANDVLSDSYESTFGIRKLQLDVNKGLRINGKSVKLRGGCIHHDSGVIGAATFENAEERRVRRLKEAGYNAIRSAHHPMGKALLRACDKVGMYVMDEYSDVWSTTKADYDYGLHMPMCWEQDVTNWVLKDYNHPCVILYSIGNEIPETGNRFDSAWGKKIADKVRELDNTRYVMNSVNLMLSIMAHMDELMQSAGVAQNGAESGQEINSLMSNLGEAMGMLAQHPLVDKYTEESFGQLDIAGYNYAEDRYEQDCVKFPNRIMIGSETFPAALAKNWAIIEKHPNVLGDFVWTSWDYLGEVGIGRNVYEGEDSSFMGSFPWRTAYCGTISISGVREPVSYWREIVWHLRKDPYIAVCPPERYGQKFTRGLWGFSDARNSWTWPGYEGKPVRVEVYADADEVELFVNGKSVSVKKPEEDLPFITAFDVVYQQGEIRAVAVKNGEKTEYCLKSASGASVLKVEAEQDTICVDTEVGYVDISIMDENGMINPADNRKLTVQVEGGVLMGLGSDNPCSNENYHGSSCFSFEGRALAIVRASQPGEIRVHVEADGLESRDVALRAVEA